MKLTKILRNGICVTGCAVVGLIAIPEVRSQDDSIEEKTHIHRLKSERRATYDAFTYVNRLPEELGEGETPIQLSGRLFGRLANQEGRILLKLPPGMSKESYLAYKSFFQYEGAASVGNCAACHVPAEFVDDKKYVVSKGGSAVATRSLRNMTRSDEELTAILKQKIQAAKDKKAGADEIDDAFSVMNLTEKDIPSMVEFLKLLNDKHEDDFRELILNSEIIDTSFLWE